MRSCASTLISGMPDAEDQPFPAVVGQALDVAGQLDDQRDRHVVDATPSRRCRRRGSPACPRSSAGAEAISLPPSLADDGPVVADQREAAVDQAQREVGLARSRTARRSAPPGRRSRRVMAWRVSELRRDRSCAVRGRQDDGEAGARRRVVAVGHVDLPVMALDDRPGDRQAESRMAAEILRPPALLNGSG